MQRIHLIGIGGAGMSAIAKVLLELGYAVSGSDQIISPLAEALRRQGARIHEGHAAANLGEAEAVVVSSAIPLDNPELAAARQRRIPVFKRADFLGQMMDGHSGVAVAGTHGKTTTTGLIAFLLDRAGLDPTFIVGGVLADYGTNARAGKGQPFVVEADEYDRMFLGLRPTVAVITSVEHDHPDTYPTLAEMQRAFEGFVRQLPADGLLVACARDPWAQAMAQARRLSGLPAVTYGLRRGDDFRAEGLQVNSLGGYDFLVVAEKDQVLGSVQNRLPGEHNVFNSLAALAVADFMEIDFNTARSALAEYQGVGRRFEIKGQARGVTVVDDYAHHPTEIRATLSAARQRFAGHPLWVMFQPHTYSRTRALLNDFAAAFHEADHVVVVDIFRSREQPTDAVNAADIVNRMNHPDACHIPLLPAAADYLSARLRPGDVLLTLGAGDGDWVGLKVLETLHQS